jgi:hypothetical protein
MAWIDAETGRPYTEKELAKLQASTPEPQAQRGESGASATQVEQPNGPVSIDQSTLENFGSGAMASLKKTYLGLKQLATYVTGNPEARQAVNDEIKRMEEEYGPALNTTAGKVGEVAGTIGQFVVPGMAAAKIGKAIPATAAIASKLFGAPGSIGRAAVTAGAFEGVQPNLPGNTRMEDLLLQRAARAAVGAGAGATIGAVANKLTRPGVKQLPILNGIEKEAERVGLKGNAALTPAQRTGDVDLLQYEEGLLSSPGSQNLIRARRDAQQNVLNSATSKVLGYPTMPPTEAVFGMARDNANLAYEPIAKIPKMSPDVPYFDALTNFAKQQAVKATGSKDAANVARRLQKGSGKITGQGFLEELQGVRDMAFGASKRGDTATAGQLKDLSGIMEDFLERRLNKLATQPGNTITTDTLQQFKDARLQHSVIRQLEKATDPVLGKVNPSKVLTGQFARQRPGATASPTTQALQDISDVSRVLRKVSPYIGSSGTAERLGGQRMVEESLNPLASLRMAPVMARNYLAARQYLAHGGQPGPLGQRLTPGQNLFIRRLLPPEAIGAGEAAID